MFQTYYKALKPMSSVHEQSDRPSKVTHYVQDTFQPIPGLISCAGVTGSWGLLSHAQTAVKVAGLIHTTGRSTLNIAPLCTAVLQQLLLRYKEL